MMIAIKNDDMKRSNDIWQHFKALAKEVVQIGIGAQFGNGMAEIDRIPKDDRRDDAIET